MRAILWAILLSFLVLLAGCLTGCAAPMFPRELGQAAQAIAVSISDQAVWNDTMAGVDGEVINPGVVGYVGVLYVAGGRLEGVSGRVSMQAKGGGSGSLSAEARAQLLRLIQSDTQLLHEAIDAVRQPPPDSNSAIPNPDSNKAIIDEAKKPPG